MWFISNMILEISNKMLEINRSGGSKMVNIGWIIVSVGTAVLMAVEMR
jgi:hypothetical protein